MRDRLPPLDWLRTFEAAARHSGFTAAADELALTQASVSYHIRSLEKWLGHALFERRARSVYLTDMGRGYLPAVRRALDELSLATVDLFGAGARQVVTVRTTTAFAVLWMARRLHRFTRDHPDIEIRLSTTNWATATPEDNIDIDIRYGDGTWPDFNCQVLLHEPALIVCHRDLAAKPIRRLADLADQTLIHVLGTGDLWEGLFRTAGRGKVAPRKMLRVDTSVAALELACAGTGIALALKSFAAPYLRDGRLVQPINIDVATGQSHYLVTPPQLRPFRSEVLLFRNWLLQEARRPEASASSPLESSLSARQ